MGCERDVSMPAQDVTLLRGHGINQIKKRQRALPRRDSSLSVGCVNSRPGSRNLPSLLNIISERISRTFY